MEILGIIITFVVGVGVGYFIGRKQKFGKIFGGHHGNDGNKDRDVEKR